MKETHEIIMAALAKVAQDEKAERTLVILNPCHGYGTPIYLALTPSQLALLDALDNNGILDDNVEITLLADVEWEIL